MKDAIAVGGGSDRSNLSRSVDRVGGSNGELMGWVERVSQKGVLQSVLIGCADRMG